MPYSLLIVFFATGLTLLAAGSPLGVIFLVLGAIVTSLKLGMLVVRDHPQPCVDRVGRAKPHFLIDRTGG